ncbi:hypothetical protein BDR06DRAFT_940238 [Suillus hirtellus]|nr:hypothetical protein BDR06DRAFT_940238 [Suillus hirtellus]
MIDTGTRLFALLRTGCLVFLEVIGMVLANFLTLKSASSLDSEVGCNRTRFRQKSSV